MTSIHQKASSIPHNPAAKEAEGRQERVEAERQQEDHNPREQKPEKGEGQSRRAVWAVVTKHPGWEACQQQKPLHSSAG